LIFRDNTWKEESQGDGIRPAAAARIVAVRLNLAVARSGDKTVDLLTPGDSNTRTLNTKSEIGAGRRLVGARSGGRDSNSSGIGLEGNEKRNRNAWSNKCPH
jgi:hypothetical protein